LATYHWFIYLAEVSLTYRFAKPDELPEISRLVTHSFPGANRPLAQVTEQLRDPVIGGGVESLFIAENKARPAAALHLYPLRQWIGGELIPVAGVGMVTVSPTHRKQRVAGDLMTHALRAAHERGDLGSALYPFRVSFYQKLGYGQAGVAEQFLIPPDGLPDSQERLRIELLDQEASQREALELYQRWAVTQTGQLQRNERLWAELCTVQDRALVGYRAEGGALEGYALVIYRTDLPRPRRYLEVDEMVWTSGASRRGLYAWLASLNDQWERILIRELPSQRLGDWIREPRLPPDSAPPWRLYAAGATLLFGPMFRIVNLESAWQQRRVADAKAVAIGFDVVDEQIEENRGKWRLTFEHGRVAIDQKAAQANIRLNVSTLSRLYIGSLSPRAALAAGLLECDRPEVLDPLGQLLALPEPWTFDRF
jgi:predicted acetyltransferase